MQEHIKGKIGVACTPTQWNKKKLDCKHVEHLFFFNIELANFFLCSE